MDSFIGAVQNRPEVGTIVEGPVITIEPKAVYVDLAPHGTGIIYGREFVNARSIIKNVNVGDTIEAKITEQENEDGYIELSLKEARQAIIWAEAEEAIKKSSILELPVKEANKGGLLLEWNGITGFLPASQLKPDHYPRVDDGDRDKILLALKGLVGQKINVSIISAAPKEGKLIFSEKDHSEEDREIIVGRYEVGDVVSGQITGVTDFGIFIKIQDSLEGLAHISELDWGLVDDPREMFRVGENIKAKIIEKTDGKVSLSIKQLKENPWEAAVSKYQPGSMVKGVIIKYNRHGALASVEEGIAGLVHISDFKNEDELRAELSIGQLYDFEVTVFEPKDRRMALKLRK